FSKEMPEHSLLDWRVASLCVGFVSPWHWHRQDSDSKNKVRDFPAFFPARLYIPPGDIVMRRSPLGKRITFEHWHLLRTGSRRASALRSSKKSIQNSREMRRS